MQIKKIHIQNFKSLVDFELDNPKQFCAFVGPNASGKSNIFEALEFLNYMIRYTIEAPSFFDGKDSIQSFNSKEIYIGNGLQKGDLKYNVTFINKIEIDIGASYDKNNDSRFYQIISNPPTLSDFNNPFNRKQFLEYWVKQGNSYDKEMEVFFDNFSRIFVGKSELVRINSKSSKLKTDASNLAQILWQIFQDENKKEDFIDWLRILVPEFEDIVVKQSNIDDSHEFLVKEKGSEKLFPSKLLSDGTKNILALMAAVYQGNEPQFLCIEEPENGLHPNAIEMLVDFFRDKCETEGHHIWLNTHSQTLVRAMKIDELVLVNKINGRTQAKRIEGINGLDIKTDEAWLTNALGGGVLWSK